MADEECDGAVIVTGRRLYSSGTQVQPSRMLQCVVYGVQKNGRADLHIVGLIVCNSQGVDASSGLARWSKPAPVWSEREQLICLLDKTRQEAIARSDTWVSCCFINQCRYPAIARQSLATNSEPLPRNWAAPLSRAVSPRLDRIAD